MNYTIETKEVTLPLREFTERFVDVAKFLGYCKECPSYNVRCCCPPYDFNPEDLWRKYREVKISGVKIVFDAADVGTVLDSDACNRVYTEILQKEADALYVRLKEEELAAPDRLLLNAGPCRICGDKTCDRREHKCRRPEMRRFSIESLGGDVSAVTTDLLGFDLHWIEGGKLPPYLCQIGGMLYK